MTRPKTYAQKIYDDQRRRISTELGLTAPSKDHAGQIERLRRAVANTATSSRPQLGLLLWRGGIDTGYVASSLGAPRGCFTITVNDIVSTWRNLYACPAESIVFDPFELAKLSGEFAAIVKRKRFEWVIGGVEACRAEVAHLKELGVLA